MRLLHPLLDDLTLHYPKQGDGILLALTECGANHLLTLMLNRPELIAFRLEQNEIALLRPLDRALRQKLQDAQKTTYQLETELERMERNVDDNDWRQRRCELMY